jgi:hypothetical protein
LDTHVNPPSLACSLAACKNRIDFGYVLLVVDDAPIEFDPGVREERQLLDADHHFGGVAMLLEEARRCRGALQAQNLLAVEGGCHIYGVTNLQRGDGFAGRRAKRSVPHLIVDCRKISSKQRRLKAEKF